MDPSQQRAPEPALVSAEALATFIKSATAVAAAKLPADGKSAPAPAVKPESEAPQPASSAATSLPPSEPRPSPGAAPEPPKPPKPQGAGGAAAGPQQSSRAGRGNITSTADLTDDYIRNVLKVEVSHESCNMIRTINTQLQKLKDEGVVRYIRSTDEDNCVWGFRVLEVESPLRFNQAFRSLGQPGRDNQPLKRPTEVYMKTLRFCGVTARRGARGPRETDPDPRDFMYSYYYDFVSCKEEYNRRKLCTNGYSKEAREIAGKHKGEFLESDLMPRRTKRATEMRASAAAANAAATAAAAAAAAALSSAGTADFPMSEGVAAASAALALNPADPAAAAAFSAAAAAAAVAASTGLDALFEVAAAELARSQGGAAAAMVAAAAAAAARSAAAAQAAQNQPVAATGAVPAPPIPASPGTPAAHMAAYGGIKPDPPPPPPPPPP